MTTSDQEPDLRGSSFGELLHRATDEVISLVRAEIELAKSELTDSAKGVAAAVAFGAVAAVLGACALGAGTAFAILLLATQMTAWLAALAVTIVLVAAAGIVALVAKSKLSHVAPHDTVTSLQENAAWAKAEIRSVAK